MFVSNLCQKHTVLITAVDYCSLCHWRCTEFSFHLSLPSYIFVDSFGFPVWVIIIYGSEQFCFSYSCLCLFGVLFPIGSTFRIMMIKSGDGRDTFWLSIAVKENVLVIFWNVCWVFMSVSWHTAPTIHGLPLFMLRCGLVACPPSDGFRMDWLLSASREWWGDEGKANHQCPT